MKKFTSLFTKLDQTTKTLVRVASPLAYFEEVEDKDRLWARAILSHRRPKRIVKTSLLREWAEELADIPL